MRVYNRKGSGAPQAGEWVNFVPANQPHLLCSRPYRITRTSPNVVYFNIPSGPERYKYVSTVLFIGTEQECQEAYDQAVKLATILERQHQEVAKAAQHQMSLLRDTITLGTVTRYPVTRKPLTRPYPSPEPSNAS